jgi:hypothetical protein
MTADTVETWLRVGLLAAIVFLIWLGIAFVAVAIWSLFFRRDKS